MRVKNAWIGGVENRKNARTLEAAAHGLTTVAKIIREIPLSDT